MISATFITWTEAVEAATSAASRTPCGGSNPTEGAYPAVLTYVVRGYVARGFTLVEVLVVIAIAVALSAIAVPIYQSYMDEVRLSNARKDIALISLHLERYRTENRGKLPDTLAPTPAGTMKDPWGNPYRYLNIEDAAGPGLGNVRKDKNLVPLNTDFDLYSMGKDGASKPPLTAATSHDDIVRANNGGYVGLASEY